MKANFTRWTLAASAAFILLAPAAFAAPDKGDKFDFKPAKGADSKPVVTSEPARVDDRLKAIGKQLRMNLQMKGDDSISVGSGGTSRRFAVTREHYVRSKDKVGEVMRLVVDVTVTPERDKRAGSLSYDPAKGFAVARFGDKEVRIEFDRSGVTIGKKECDSDDFGCVAKELQAALGNPPADQIVALYAMAEEDLNVVAHGRPILSALMKLAELSAVPPAK